MVYDILLNKKKVRNIKQQAQFHAANELQNESRY